MLFLKFFCRSFVLAAFVLTAVVTLSGCPDATSPQTRVDSVIINSPGFVFRGGDFQLSAQVLGVNVTNTVRWYLDMEDENYNSAYSEAAHAPVEDISLPAFAEDMGFDIRAFAEALSDQQITRSRITPDGLLQVARYDGVDDEVPEYIWVRAVSTQNPAVEGRYKVRINSPGFTINGIRPYPYSSAREPQVLFAGSSQQFSFTLDADPYWYAPKDVRWYLIHSNTKNPATQLQQGPGGEVTLVTYDNYEVPHTVVIQVRSLGDRRVRGWAFVEIVPSIVQDITITPPADLPALRGAITQPFSAEVTGIGTPSQAVTWSISSNTIFGTALVPVTGTHKVKLAVAQRESYENSPLRLRATSVQDPAVFAEIDVPVEGERLVGQWRQVSVGNDHVLAIDWNHQVWSWGRNTAGQVGVGNRISPVQNPTLVTPPGIKFRAVAAGLSHSFAIQYDPGGSDDFRLWSWGNGQYGKLGHAAGHTSDILTPTPIQFALQFGWDTISAGRDHSAGIKTNTTLYTWGRARVTFTGGSAYVLGQGSTNVDARIPTRRFRDDPNLEEGWAAVAAGVYHTAALRRLDAAYLPGTIWTTGRNHRGQLGLGDTTNRVYFEMVPSPPGVRFAEITSGEDFIIALDEQRRMWIWGNGLNGMLGDGLTGESHYSSSPLMLTVPGVSGWRYVKVGNGSRHVIAIANDGSLWTWGMNHRGQLGHGEFDFPGFEGNNVAPPRNVMPGSTWLSANAGGWFSQAIREDSVFLGTLWGWGDNRYYQLGLGFDTPGQLGIHTPQRVQLTDQQPFSIGF